MTVRDDETSGCRASRRRGTTGERQATGRDLGSAGGRRGERPVTAVPERRRPVVAPTGLPALSPDEKRPENADAGDPRGRRHRVERSVDVLQMGRTVSACGPFAPWLASKETRWFSSRVRNPSD